MHRETHHRASEAVLIRSYEQGDYLDLNEIWTCGHTAGAGEHHEPELDLCVLEENYFSRPQDRFWIAERAGIPIGVIGVLGMDDATAHVCCLRVDAASKDTDLPYRLLQVAIDHCRRHDYLKIVIMTSVRKRRALPMVERCGFQISGAVNIDGQELLEFFLDVYH